MSKAFVILHGINVVPPDGGAYATGSAVVFDSSGSRVRSPDAGSGDDSPFGFFISFGATSTLASIRGDVQAAVVAAYGFTPSFLWLDDRGLL